MSEQLLLRDNTLFINGVLSFDTVMLTYHQGGGLMLGLTEPVVDLSGITRCNSAGLALLVEWSRDFQARGKKVRYINMPEQMRAIAEFSGLNYLLSE